MSKRTDARIRAYLVWLGGVALGCFVGRVLAQAAGDAWAPRGVDFLSWMFARLSHSPPAEEVVTYLVFVYGCVAVSGMIGAAVATFSRQFHQRVPYALIAGLSALWHAAVISSIRVLIGNRSTVILTLAAIGVAVAFAVILERAVGPIKQPPSESETGPTNPILTGGVGFRSAGNADTP